MNGLPHDVTVRPLGAGSAIDAVPEPSHDRESRLHAVLTGAMPSRLPAELIALRRCLEQLGDPDADGETAMAAARDCLDRVDVVRSMTDSLLAAVRADGDTPETVIDRAALQAFVERRFPPETVARLQWDTACPLMVGCLAHVGSALAMEIDHLLRALDDEMSLRIRLEGDADVAWIHVDRAPAHGGRPASQRPSPRPAGEQPLVTRGEAVALEHLLDRFGGRIVRYAPHLPRRASITVPQRRVCDEDTRPARRLPTPWVIDATVAPGSSRSPFTRQRLPVHALVSHEIRTPLTVIHGVVDLLATTDAGPAREQLVAPALRNTDRLARTIGRLRGSIGLTPDGNEQRVSPHAVVRLLADHLPAGIVGRLTVMDDLDLQRQVHTDPAIVAAILDELLDNAERHGGGITDVQLFGEHADAQHPDGWAVLAVHDHGPGMPDEILRSGPRPFAQRDRSIQRGAEGLGIGLVAVHALAEAIGARLDLRPGGLGGTVARLGLPLAP